MTDDVVAIDLGGTKSVLALVAPDNTIKAQVRLETGREARPEAVLADFEEVIQGFKGRSQGIRAIGLCAPGPLDHEHGVIVNPTNLPHFFNTPLREMLEKRFALPTVIEHDAKAAALGEFHFGAGKAEQSLIYIVIGTGVGAAIIIHGQLYRGLKNFAGEFGHTTLDRFGEVCNCGSRGCFETYMSGPWIAKRYAMLNQEEISGAEVVKRAEQGETKALEVLSLAGEALGIAVASMAMNFDIECFVVGGGVSIAGELLLAPARKDHPQLFL
ncbi:MAG: ROK family protein [Deinococcales bacterium]